MNETPPEPLEIDMLLKPSVHDRDRFHDKTARTIAYTLLIALGISFLLQYITLTWFIDLQNSRQM